MPAGARSAGDACGDLQLLFGENFRAARIKAELTQGDIKALTGIKQAYVSQIETGKQNPTLATMALLALAVGKDVRTLLKPRPTATKPK